VCAWQAFVLKMMHLQGSLPSRMSREGAARTYHMYTYWGYFNRRMSARRQLEQKTMPGSKESTGIAFGDNSKQQKSYYGEMTNVWRYFENVPDAISDLRTKEAAQVADRHLRSVFSLNAGYAQSPMTCFPHISLPCSMNLLKESKPRSFQQTALFAWSIAFYIEYSFLKPGCCMQGSLW